MVFQRMVLRLAFSERIAYCRKEGYRTPKTSLLFKALRDLSFDESQMVLPGRETSNTNLETVFEALEEWNDYLKAERFDPKNNKLQSDNGQNPVQRGPSP